MRGSAIPTGEGSARDHPADQGSRGLERGCQRHPGHGFLDWRARIAQRGTPLIGDMAAWNYFHSVNSPENEAFVKMWTDFNGQRDKTTNDPMEATLIGFRMWAQAVVQAGTRRRRSPAGDVRPKN